MTSRTQAQRSASTQTALVTAAREVFTEKGLSGASLDEIVARAGVTKGAMYHHYRDKLELFEAVYATVEAELHEQIAASVAQAASLSDAVRRGAQMYLEFCIDPTVRVAILDGPVAMGWRRARFGDVGGIFEDTKAVLGACLEAGIFAPQPSVELFAHFFVGSLEEGALLIAHSDDPRATCAEVVAAFDVFIDSLRGDRVAAQPSRTEAQ